MLTGTRTLPQVSRSFVIQARVDLDVLCWESSINQQNHIQTSLFKFHTKPRVHGSPAGL